MQAVVHIPPFAARLDEFGVLEYLQVMRDVDHLCFEEFGHVTDGQLTMTQRIDHPQPQRIAQSLEAFGTEFSVKTIGFHSRPATRTKNLYVNGL